MKKQAHQSLAGRKSGMGIMPMRRRGVSPLQSTGGTPVGQPAGTTEMAGPNGPLAGYEVLLGVTGGIACYKSADLVSKLVQAGAGVTVAMTASAEQFITPLTFQSLCLRPVYRNLWQATEEWKSGHISLTEQADLFLLAPATANILAKMACGLADDLVSTLALAASGECPLLVAPAMNSRMWLAPPTQANMKRLASWGVQVVGPGEGFLACRTVGPGRMAEPAEILAAATKILKKKRPKRRM